MRIRYTPRAFGDLVRIRAYLNDKSPRAAEAVIGAIEAGVQRLERFPVSAEEVPGGSIRVLTIRQYSYRVFFRSWGEEVVILHIRNTRRRPWTAPTGP